MIKDLNVRHDTVQLKENMIKNLHNDGSFTLISWILLQMQAITTRNKHVRLSPIKKFLDSKGNTLHMESTLVE